MRKIIENQQCKSVERKQVMSHFAIDSHLEIAYTLATPQGVSGKAVFENKQSVTAVSNQLNQGQSEAKKSLRQACHSLIEWHFGVCLQQKCQKRGVGVDKICDPLPDIVEK